MRVTEILKRRGHLYEVRFDDGTYILLDKQFLEDRCYKVGMEIDEEQADKDEAESDIIRAKNRALYYLSGSDYSRKGLSDKLKTAGFPPFAVEKAVLRMEELGFLDDVRFASRFAERCNEQCLSYRETVEKLVLKGVDRDTAKQAAEVFKQNETEKIKQLLNRKYSAKLDGENGAEKVVAALMRKGFSVYDIKSALKEE